MAATVRGEKLLIFALLVLISLCGSTQTKNIILGKSSVCQNIACLMWIRCRIKRKTVLSFTTVSVLVELNLEKLFQVFAGEAEEDAARTCTWMKAPPRGTR